MNVLNERFSSDKELNWQLCSYEELQREAYANIARVLSQTVSNKKNNKKKPQKTWTMIKLHDEILLCCYALHEFEGI